MKLSKSKLALAKVINENGGWPERALWAAQDNCIAFFLGGKPEYKSGDRCWYSNSIDGACVGTITCDEKVANWHKTILSREEYYQAYPVSDADGWIEWNGGECPVDVELYVYVNYRDGCELPRAVRAGSQRWDHFGLGGDIVSYRLRNHANMRDTGAGDPNPVAEPEFCESVMRSIPEPKPFKCAHDPKLTSLANVRIVDESIGDLCAKVTEENKHQHVDAKPTIEQLAQDYRNKLDFASSKRQEADEAKAAADAALGELERAGDALGLLIGIAKPDQEPELVITDWRDLQVGDEIECVGYGHPHTIGVVERFDEISVDQNIFVRHQNGDVSWPRLWNFIRRP